MSATTDDVLVDSSPRDEDVITPAGGLGAFVTAARPASITVLILGILGFVASSTLTIERIELLKDPSYRPSCSINPIISCGSVMVTKQAAIFGFPNPLIGIAAFAVVIVTGVLAATRVALPKWYWLGLSIGTLAGMVMINFLWFQSVYRIHALCPYCMVVWVVTPIIMILSVGRVLGDSRRGREITSWLWVALPVWYVIVLVAIGTEFWDYWSTLI